MGLTCIAWWRRSWLLRRRHQFISLQSSTKIYVLCSSSMIDVSSFYYYYFWFFVALASVHASSANSLFFYILCWWWCVMIMVIWWCNNNWNNGAIQWPLSNVQGIHIGLSQYDYSTASPEDSMTRSHYLIYSPGGRVSPYTFLYEKTTGLIQKQERLN